MNRDPRWHLEAAKDLAARLAHENACDYGVYGDTGDGRSAPYTVISCRQGNREGRGLPLFTLCW